MFIEQLKALYINYWPEHTRALHGETEVALLCQWGFRQYRDSGGKDISDYPKEQFVAVSTIPVASAECDCGFWTA